MHFSIIFVRLTFTACLQVMQLLNNSALACVYILITGNIYGLLAGHNQIGMIKIFNNFYRSLKEKVHALDHAEVVLVLECELS